MTNHGTLSNNMRNSLILILALVLLLSGCGADGPHYDVLIRGGTIVDGTGSEPYVGDVALVGERIAAVGALGDATADQEIDATGLHVAPGYIDVHSHASGSLAREELRAARSILAQGVTTVVINPDGGGPIDLATQRDRLLENGIGVNAVQLVPHGSIRGEVLGNSDRDPTAEELERMKAYVTAGMEAGAFGMSSGLFYTPANYSKTEEVIEMAKMVAPFDGVYSSHIRDEADYGIGVVAAVDEVIRIAREAEIPGIVSHIKALGPNVWGQSERIIANIEAARAEGVEVWADQYPYEASQTGFTAALVPAWAREGEGLRPRLEDPATAARVKADMAENLARRGGGQRIMFGGTGPLAGRTLAEVAAQNEQFEIDAAVDLIQEGGVGSIISFNMDDDDIARFMTQPWTMTSSDGDLVELGRGVPHPRAFGAFARKIRKYVVEDGVLDLRTAVRAGSGLAAEVFRIEDRGFIREGAIADVLVFDLARVNDPATYIDPHHISEGMVYVFVNGVAGISDGEFTDALAGQVLHRAGAAQAGRKREASAAATTTEG